MTNVRPAGERLTVECCVSFPDALGSEDLVGRQNQRVFDDLEVIISTLPVARKLHFVALLHHHDVNVKDYRIMMPRAF